MATMQDTFLLLVREAERLVTAPYAPALQDLHSLTQRASPSIVSSWAAHKPCQVGALADVLVDSLSRSRFALPLIACLARAPEFRERLIQQHSHLLDQFLRHAIDGKIEFRPICISLLSSPLPCGVIPPASLAPFVMELIRQMRDKPCADTVRPLYLISSCLQSSGILFELPQEVMVSFQTELTKTLRNLEEHLVNLLCLATFARIVSPSSSGAEELDNPSWLQSIRHFFGPKRGLKTLDLVVLRVILASSSNGNLTAYQAAESIRLAIDICDSVNRAQRERWIEGNSIKVAKLLEKITREGVDHNVQMLGSSFLVSLIPTTSPSPDLMKLCLEWLVSDEPATILNTIPPHIISRLVEANAACLGQFTSIKVLDYVCSSLSISVADDLRMARLQMAKFLLGGLQTSTVPILSALADTTSEYNSAINNLMETFPRQACQLRCDGVNTCYASASRLENDLLSDLLSFWLEATLSPKVKQTVSGSTEMAMLRGFMTRDRLLLPGSRCTFSEIKLLDSRAPFLSLKNHETVHPPRDDWRKGIRDAMMINSEMLNNSVMEKVEDACYELEQRCKDIEAPLRAAEEERSKTHLDAERLKEQKNDLETQLQQASRSIADLRGGMARLQGHANSATARVEELSESLARALNELEELRHTSHNALISERESSRTKELDMIAALTERDDRLEEIQDSLKRQTEETEHLGTELASISKEKKNSLEEIAALRHGVSTLQAELSESRIIIAQKDEAFEKLVNEKESFEQLIENLQNNLHAEISEFERLRTVLEDSTDKFKSELEELKEKSELKHSEWTEEATETKSVIVSLQRALEESTLNSRRDVQTKDKRIHHLERKVQQLREERAAKAREFSEAQQHISRLMGVMGFKPAASDARAPSKQRPRPSFEPSQAATMQTQTDSRDGILQSREEDLLATSLKTDISCSGGRSPKRPRNSAFPSAQPSPPRSTANTRKPKEPVSRGKAKQYRERRPLEEADHNSKPNSQSSGAPPYDCQESFQPTQPNNQADQNHLDDIDLDLDLDFSKYFVFTSTSLSEMNVHA
ncbi:hypothetical protein BJX99DRAFT_30692 [Aspergillus californicus]